MKRLAPVVFPALLFFTASTWACAAGAPETSEEPMDRGASAADAAPDTVVRGLIAVIGPDPTAYPVLRPTGQVGEIALSGDLIGALRRLAGVHVALGGSIQESGNRMSVTAIRVREVDGVSAVDGILRRDDRGLFLETARGPRSIVQAPEGMTELIDSWIWVAGIPEESPDAYGIIDPDP